MTKHEQYHTKVRFTQSGPRGIQQEPREYHQSCFGPALFVVLAIVAVIVILFATGALTVWEDGSFRLFHSLSGCLPGGWCNL